VVPFDLEFVEKRVEFFFQRQLGLADFLE